MTALAACKPDCQAGAERLTLHVVRACVIVRLCRRRQHPSRLPRRGAPIQPTPR